MHAHVGIMKQWLVDIPHIYVSYGRSEKKKSLVGGGGPATIPLGISTFSPARSVSDINNRRGGRKEATNLVA